MYFLQVGASDESIITYCRNTIANGYRSKMTAIVESIVANCRNTIGNGYRS